MSKGVVWTGVLVGSTIGGFIPGLWGAGLFSAWSIILSTVGGVLGIVVVYKLYQSV